MICITIRGWNSAGQPQPRPTPFIRSKLGKSNKGEKHVGHVPNLDPTPLFQVNPEQSGYGKMGLMGFSLMYPHFFGRDKSIRATDKNKSDPGLFQIRIILYNEIDNMCFMGIPNDFSITN